MNIPTHKWCKSCDPITWKPIEEFSRRSKSKDGHNFECKVCESKRHQAYYKRKRTKAIHRRSNLKILYGMSVEEFDRLFKEQHGACAICGRVGVKLVVDHNHRTGKRRGLLCSACNHGLGRFRDDPQLLENAKQYLEYHDGREDEETIEGAGEELR